MIFVYVLLFNRNRFFCGYAAPGEINRGDLRSESSLIDYFSCAYRVLDRFVQHSEIFEVSVFVVFVCLDITI